MLYRLAAAFLLATIGVTGFAPAAKSWGYDGHRIVALIAIKLLPPEKAQALDKLLQESQIGRGFVDASGYADDVLRAEDKDFDPWHYMTWHADSKDPADQKCQPTCLLRALTEQFRTFKKSTDKEERAFALSWIIHLIGDMHMPLHVGDLNDFGGNGFKVTYDGKQFCGKAPPFAPMKPMNLHKVWDECLVLTIKGDRTREAVADEIRGSLTTYKGHEYAKGLRRDWAMESHLLARDVYGDLDEKDDIRVGSEYVTEALKIVRMQLLRAGVRLAWAVDEAI
jgi:hypothetical protein